LEESDNKKLQDKEAALATMKAEMLELQKKLQAQEAKDLQTSKELQAKDAAVAAMKKELLDKGKTAEQAQKKYQAFTKLIQEQEGRCREACSWYSPLSCKEACTWKIPDTFLESA